MKQNYFYFGAVLDRSGSMGSGGKIEEARNGFNTLVADKKKQPYKADIMVTIFDNSIDTLYEGDLQACPALTVDNFFPRGMTSLYDAMGISITKIGEKLAALSEEERPEKVIICIITDGQENNSHEYNGARLREMITNQRNTYSWEFMFIGADEKSIQDAQSLGVINTMQTPNTVKGINMAYRGYSSFVDGLTHK